VEVSEALFGPARRNANGRSVEAGKVQKVMCFKKGGGGEGLNVLIVFAAKGEIIGGETKVGSGDRA